MPLSRKSYFDGAVGFDPNRGYTREGFDPRRGFTDSGFASTGSDAELAQYQQQAEDAVGAPYGSIARENDPNRFGSAASATFPTQFGSQPARGLARGNPNSTGLPFRFDGAAADKNLSDVMKKYAAEQVEREAIKDRELGIARKPVKPVFGVG